MLPPRLGSQEAEPEIGIQGWVGLGESSEGEDNAGQVRKEAGKELGSAGVKPPLLQGGPKSVKSSKVGLILLVPHASWSLVRACLGCVCFGRRDLPTEAVRMRAIHSG